MKSFDDEAFNEFINELIENDKSITANNSVDTLIRIAKLAWDKKGELLNEVVAEETVFEKGEKDFQVYEQVGYLKSIQGNDEYSTFVNQNFEYADERVGGGGFAFTFLDFRPDDIENYKPIFIYMFSVADIIKQKDIEIKELEDECKDKQEKINKLEFMIENGLGWEDLKS